MPVPEARQVATIGNIFALCDLPALTILLTIARKNGDGARWILSQIWSIVTGSGAFKINSLISLSDCSAVRLPLRPAIGLPSSAFLRSTLAR